jgi:hypothetical protein
MEDSDVLRTPLTRRMPIKGPRLRKCAVKGCANRFQPRNMGHKVCGPECAAIHAVTERKRLDAKQTRERKQAMKTRSDYLKSAQAAFNKFIRERDAHLPCISCGRFHTGAYDAGHYRSVGAQPALRFHEDNCHKQCVPCNQHKSGNVVEYRLGLIARIGAERVAFLEQEHAPAKFTIEEARQIKAHYVAKMRALREKA